MNAARSAGYQILINIAENGFVRVEVIEVIRPKAIIHGNANKVKSKCGQKIQCLHIGWFRPLIWIPGIHPLEIKTIILPAPHQQAWYRVYLIERAIRVILLAQLPALSLEIATNSSRKTKFFLKCN
jgi:hypothetical protein